MRTTDIYNKEYRRRLINRWLATETTVEEERRLAEYYRDNRPDSDEKDAAELILAMQSMPAEEPTADIDAEEEYDRILKNHSEKVSKRRFSLIMTAVAAAAAVVFILIHAVPGDERSAIEPEAAVITKAETTKTEPETAAVTKAETIKNVPTKDTTITKEKLSLISDASPGATRKQRHSTARRPSGLDSRGTSTVSMEDMIECMKTVEALGLEREDGYEIVPTENNVLIRLGKSGETPTAFIAVNSEEDGSMQLVSMENINF